MQRGGGAEKDQELHVLVTVKGKGCGQRQRRKWQKGERKQIDQRERRAIIRNCILPNKRQRSCVS